MVYKLFLDINILIDLLDKKRSNHEDAATLISAAEDGRVYSFVTESVLNTASYLIRKDFSVKRTIELFNHYLSFTELIPIDNAIYLSGLQAAVNDIEDAILYSAALHQKLNYFITNDIKDFHKIQTESLPVMVAKEFLKLLK